MDVERLKSVEQFLYREARLLDDRRFNDWLQLLTDDIHYWMPTRFNRMAEGPDEDWDIERELDELCYFDDEKSSLVGRVDRFNTGMAWSENPPSRTRHLITNIEVIDDRGDELDVRSNFMLYRNRLRGVDGDEEFFIGRRDDILRAVEGGWMLASRRVILDQVLLKAGYLSVFF